MPILGAEPDIYPDDLLQQDVADPWWVVYTRSRQEKVLMRALRQAKVAHYCPLIPRRQRSPRGRVLTSYLPLFSNYLFFRGDGDDRTEVFKTNCVSQIIPVTRPAELVFDLHQIYGLIQSGEAVSPEAALEPGDRVRVKSGPFKGYEGWVAQRQGKTRLIVEVRFMNQGASVEIEDCQLEPLGGSRVQLL